MKSVYSVKNELVIIYRHNAMMIPKFAHLPVHPALHFVFIAPINMFLEERTAHTQLDGRITETRVSAPFVLSLLWKRTVDLWAICRQTSSVSDILWGTITFVWCKYAYGAIDL